MTDRKAIWKNDASFSYGSPGAPAPVFDKTELVGTGDSAYVRLATTGQPVVNVPFTTPGNYIYDPTKVEVAGDKAQLKAFVASDQNWPFTTPGDYIYNASKIAVSGGTASLIGTPIAPYAWWHLNESSGLLASDSSGNGRDGTLVNMEDTDWVAGKINNCLEFNVSTIDEYVNCGAIANFERDQPFSLECWLKTTDNTFGIICKFNGSVGWTLHYENNVIFRMYGSGDGPITRKSTSSINDGSWHHIVATYDGSSTATGMHIYVDSSLDEQAPTGSLSTSIQGGGDCQLGALHNYGSFRLIGELDECVIYDKTLTLSEVQSRYNSGIGTEMMPGSYPVDNPTIYPNSSYTFANPLGNFVETATVPSGSALKYHISTDDGVTWKYWNDAAWVVTDGSYTQANLAATVNAHINTLASSGAFRFRALLHSDDGQATPVLDDIYIAEGVSYTLVPQEIAMDYDIQPAVAFEWLSFVATETKPAVTTIMYKYSIDGGASYNVSWLTESQCQSAIQALGLAANGNDMIRFKALLTTTDTLLTPEIDNLAIAYEIGYELEGTYTSTKYVPEPTWVNGLYAGEISFGVTTPSGTSVTIRARVVDNVLEANYTKPWLSYSSGDTIGICGVFLQFEATLTSDSHGVTPRLNWLEIIFHILIGTLRVMDEKIDFVSDIEGGRWVLDEDAKQMVFYKSDNVTEVARFDLKDRNGAASIQEIFERTRI